MTRKRPVICRKARPTSIPEVVPIYCLEGPFNRSTNRAKLEGAFINYNLAKACHAASTKPLKVRLRYAVKLSDGKYHYVNFTPVPLLNEADNEVQNSQGSQLDAEDNVPSDREAGDELFGTLSPSVDS